jgi:hypothetical protein
MNANELADEVEIWGRDLLALNMRGGVPVIEGARLLRQQADRIESLERDSKILMQHIADMNEDKNKLRYQKSYIVQLESVLNSSIELNKAQAERHRKAQEK